MRSRPTYRSLDKDPSCQHPIDEAVHARVDRLSRTRNLSRAAQAVLDALGKKRRLWFNYEQALGRVTSWREAAYFDIGVEYGIAATRAAALARPRAHASALAQRVLREAMRTGAAREEVVDALIVAAWAVATRTRL